MTFFRAVDGSMYPVSAIIRLGPSREVSFAPDGRKGKVTDVYIADGDSVMVRDHDVSALLKAPTHIWPSAAGTYIVHKDPESDGGYFKVPVLGWACSADYGTYPVTIEGPNDGDDHPKTVLLPDGMVVDAFGSTWDDAEKWLANSG